MLQTYTFEQTNMKLKKKMLTLFLTHALVKHVLLQTKITFEIQYFDAQLKHSNFSSKEKLKTVACFHNILISFLRDRMRKTVTPFVMACKLFEYHLAVRGYRYYKKYWQQIESKTLDCMNEKDNPFQFFAVKVMEQKLPMENSRAKTFLLDRGTRVIAKLTSCNYSILSLVQRGLETPCRVETYMASTLKNKHLINIYEQHHELF